MRFVPTLGSGTACMGIARYSGSCRGLFKLCCHNVRYLGVHTDGNCMNRDRATSLEAYGAFMGSEQSVFHN